MDYEEVMQRLIEMKSRYDVGFSSIDRNFLESLYYSLFGRNIKNRGCSDCYRDAYVEITIKLKRDKKMPEKSIFKLKPGAVITFFGESKAYTNANLTDDIAKRFLSLHENNHKLFEELPGHWRDLVEDYKMNGAKQESTEHRDLSLQKFSEEMIAETEKQKTDLQKQLEKALAERNLAQTEAYNLREELAGANESLKTALEKVEALEAEIKSLKTITKSGRTSKKTADTEVTPENNHKEEKAIDFTE